MRSPSTWQEIASWPDTIASSIESPEEEQPGRSGTVAPYPLDSSL